MPNLLAKGQELLLRLMPRDATPAGAISYVRKADPGNPINLTGIAWVGRTVFSRLPNAAGASVVFGDRDYLIPVSELPAEPEKGDRILETINGVEVKFEAQAPATEPAQRYSDPGRTVWRVHCKEVT